MFHTRAKTTLSIAIIVFAFLLSTGSKAGELSRGPYLQQASSHEIVVVWRTRGPSDPVLKVGAKPGKLSRNLAPDSISLSASADVQADKGTARLYLEPESDRLTREADHDPSTAPNSYQYEATIAGLKPKTKYYYGIYDGDTLLAGDDSDHYFYTHPKVGSTADMRIWVVGDSGTGGKAQADVHDAMQGFVQKTGRPLDHYIHVGDMAYGDGTDLQFQEHFFEPYQETLRNTVCWPTMGNHEGHTSRGFSEYGPYYDAYVVPTKAEVGGVPSGTEAYYSFDIADIHFICLDSHDLDRSPEAAMAQWLRADLEQADAKWLIAFWHHPPYTKGSHDSDRERSLVEMRENFMPILESAGVDITLSGHSHIYERSMLMDGAYDTPTTAEGVILDDGDGSPKGDGAYRKSAGLNPNEGSVSIVSGHGGAGLGREGTMPVMRQIILEHGSVILDVKGDTLTGTMINKNGVTRDLFSIVKRGKVVPERIENPWQPPHDFSLLTSIFFDFRESATANWMYTWNTIGGPSHKHIQVPAGDHEHMVLESEAGNAPLTSIYQPWQLFALDLETLVRLPTESPGFYLFFEYKDSMNNYRVHFDPLGSSIKVEHLEGGQATLIDERPVSIAANSWIELGVEGKGKSMEIFYEERDEPNTSIEYKVELPHTVDAAKVGYGLPANGSAEIRWFEIQDESK